MTKKILYILQPHETGATHRLPLLKAAIDAQYDVHIATQKDSPAWNILKKYNFSIHPIYLTRFGLNPLRDINTVKDIRSLIRSLQPDIIHNVSIKPVLYGNIALRLSHVSKSKKAASVSTISGLGTVFTLNDLKTRTIKVLVIILYRLALSNKNKKIIFQNSDDQITLTKAAKLSCNDTALIKGSGVDIDDFRPQTKENEDVLVILIARMLWAKGIKEFVDASRLIKEQNSKTRFVLVGGLDSQSPDAIPEDTIIEWTKEGIIEWWGEREDMDAIYKEASIIVLPSHREGMPKVLLEAAASGLPVVTVDTPGCREAVIHNKTGFVTPPKNPDELAKGINNLLKNPQSRIKMGGYAREHAVKNFSTKKVARDTLKIYDELLRDL